MQAVCEQMMDQFVEDYEEICDPIHSDSAFFLADKAIDEEIESRQTDIFNVSSEDDTSEDAMINKLAEDLEKELCTSDESDEFVSDRYDIGEYNLSGFYDGTSDYRTDFQQNLMNNQNI